MAQGEPVLPANTRLNSNELLVYTTYQQLVNAGLHYGRQAITDALNAQGHPIASVTVGRALRLLRSFNLLPERNQGDNRPAYILNPTVDPLPATTAQSPATPATLLDLLKASSDQSADLLFLCRELNLSPAQVDAEVVRLRQAGERIDGVKGGGYRWAGRVDPPKPEADAGPTPPDSYEENGNEAHLITRTDKQIRTLEELLAVCEVDTETWQVDWWKCKKWDTPMKLRQNGSHHAVVTTQYYVEAKLIRKVGRQLTTDMPPLQPAHFSLSPLPPLRKSESTLDLCMVVPDVHCGYLRNAETGALNPFHCRRSVGLALQLARQLRPKVCVVLGDMLDLPDWSDKFLRSPEFYETFQPTIYEAGWILAQLAQSCERVVLIEGNHSQRITKAVWTYMPQVYGIKPANTPNAPAVLSLEHLLGLRQIGVELVGPYPDGKFWVNDRLALEHGKDVSQAPGGSAGKVLQRGRQYSSGLGHTHRVESASKTVDTKDGPEVIEAYNFGTLARLDGPIPSRDKERNWQNALGMIWYDEAKDYQVEMLRVSHGAAIWQGKVVTGEDYREQLSKDVDWRY